MEMKTSNKAMALISHPDQDAGWLPDERTGTPGWIFFHGPAVACADRSEGAANRGAPDEQVVCSASWQRRFDRPVEAPFRPGSLTEFWHRLQLAERVWSSGWSPVRANWLVRVALPACPRWQRELLELVLAGASLDLPLSVCFEGPGLVRLRGQTASAWAQLADQGLAAMLACPHDADSAELPAFVEPIDAADREARVGQSGVLRVGEFPP